MPIYEFECSVHGIFERILPLREANKKRVFCNQYISTGECFIEGEEFYCKNFAEKIFSVPAYPSHGDPTVIFKNTKTGEMEVALFKGQKAPVGMVKEELKTPADRSRFEREMNVRQSAENDYETERRRYVTDFTRKQRHDDINSKIGILTKDSENPTAAAALLKSAMNRSRKKRIPRKKLGFHLAVNHHDKNNLDKE